MVVVPFGFSVGDVIAGSKILIQCFKALYESGGGASKYQEVVDYLEGLGATLERTKAYSDKHPNGAYATQIQAQVKRVESPWQVLKEFLDQFEDIVGLGKIAGQSEVRTKARRALKILKWTLKDLAGETIKLRGASAQPLHALNTILQLQTLDDIESRCGATMTKTECQEFLNQLQPTDLSPEINTAICTTLKCSAEQQRLSQKQLDEINALRQSISDMEIALQASKEADGSSSTLMEQHSRTWTSTERKAVEDQQIALLALRIGLEDQFSRLHDSTASDTASSINVSAFGCASILFTSMAASVAATLIVQKSYSVPVAGPTVYQTSEPVAPNDAEKSIEIRTEAKFRSAKATSKEHESAVRRIQDLESKYNTEFASQCPRYTGNPQDHKTRAGQYTSLVDGLEHLLGNVYAVDANGIAGLKGRQVRFADDIVAKVKMLRPLAKGTDIVISNWTIIFFVCKFRTCHRDGRKAFTREDNLMRHYKSFHEFIPKLSGWAIDQEASDEDAGDEGPDGKKLGDARSRDDVYDSDSESKDVE
ncbi:hypothetical protein EJ08DRAFT_659602 [Tothia fuscella]|uniref:Fungal N-terminal domain-containing protein n=1 Tax=Tothia fuscella TaxID=1048955 RepID=A0A9P4NTJ6_9PEZI|nr:hypothetical protein EJ08DRAFT_659602 [Tothia fuscella]